MPEREDFRNGRLLLRRMRELADKIGASQADLAQVREETKQITKQWNALVERMKKPEPEST